jgi:hypothetical protein
VIEKQNKEGKGPQEIPDNIDVMKQEAAHLVVRIALSIDYKRKGADGV